MIVSPAFSSNDVLIFLSCNNGYYPYMYVAVKSIIDHASDDQNYDIIILHAGLNLHNYDEIDKKYQEKKNVSIRFLNIEEKINGFEFFVNTKSGKAYLSQETYFKILIPYVVSSSVNKAIYLDCDIILRSDIAELFSYDLKDKYIAAVRDICDNCMCKTDQELKKYRDEVFSEEEFWDYFNAGVLVFNTKLLRRVYSEAELMKLSSSREWRKHDQDVLNYICMGKVEYLPLSWNCIECPESRIRYMGRDQLVEYKKVLKNPKLFHFATRKPWKECNVPFEKEFWGKVLETPFFFEVLEGLRSENNYSILVNQIKDNKISTIYVIKMIIICLLGKKI